MKSDKRMIDMLNYLLADELTAIDQYGPHAARAQTWGYLLHFDYVDERLGDEVKHAKSLIKRIYELEGVPNTVTRNDVFQAATLIEGLAHDQKAEQGAIAKYNAGIALAVELGDNATRDLLVANLKDEDEHLQDIEQRLVQIAQVQPAQWLSTQIR